VEYSGFVSDCACYQMCVARPGPACAADGCSDVVSAPANHTVECLLAKRCVESGFLLLNNTAAAAAPAVYAARFQLDADGNAAVLALLRAWPTSRAAAGVRLTVAGADAGDGRLLGVTAVRECVPSAANDCDGHCPGCRVPSAAALAPPASVTCATWQPPPPSAGGPGDGAQSPGSASGAPSVSLIRAHAVCMFLAFGILLPAGGFLAYTGHHKFHVFFQLGGLLLAVAGLGLAVAYVGARRSFTHAHHWLGLAVLLLGLVLQPCAILLSRRGGAGGAFWRRVHHRNGSAVILLGLCNNALGIKLLGLRYAYVTMYLFIVVVQLVFVTFDPLSMRSSRMIAMARAKQQGESTVVELSKLLAPSSSSSSSCSDSASTSRQQPAAAGGRGGPGRLSAVLSRAARSSLRQRRVLPGLGQAWDAGDTDDGNGAAGQTQTQAQAQAQQTPEWRCALQDGGARVVFTAPTQ
jgi:hypothetical protein